jgi:hypothetical protein
MNYIIVHRDEKGTNPNGLVFSLFYSSPHELWVDVTQQERLCDNCHPEERSE